MTVVNNASGQRSNAKKVTYKLPEYEGEYVLKILSKREVIALLASIEPLSWLKRHDSLPDDLSTQDALDAWVDHLRDKLMQDLDLCQIIQDCIGSQLDAMQKQLQFLQNQIGQGGSGYPPGLPLPEEEANRNLAGGSNPTCDLDILWAQSMAVMVYINRLITDILEKFEAATNDIEMVEIVTQLPVIDELGGDAIVSYVNALQEGISENYVAQYTEEYEAGCAYAIFCKAQSNDCAITMSIIYEVFQERVYARFGTPSATLSTLADLLLYLLGQEIDGTIVCDTLIFIVSGGGLLANVLLGTIGLDNLAVVLNLKKDEPSNDWATWETVFGPCPVEAFEVLANISPFDTPFGQESIFTVTNGLDYHIVATGSWDHGTGAHDADGSGGTHPTAPLPTGLVGSLVYKIGTSGDWKQAGTDINITADDDGILFFAMNDAETGYSDNTGSVSVTVTEI